MTLIYSMMAQTHNEVDTVIAFSKYEIKYIS